MDDLTTNMTKRRHAGKRLWHGKQHVPNACRTEPTEQGGGAHLPPGDQAACLLAFISSRIASSRTTLAKTRDGRSAARGLGQRESDSALFFLLTIMTREIICGRRCFVLWTG
jgi:hypothetical protein